MHPQDGRAWPRGEHGGILAGMMQSPVQVVVFDAVGTLIYPDPDVAVAYASAARRHGSVRTEREIGERFRAVFREVETRDRAGDLRTSEENEVARWQVIVRRVLDDLPDPSACFAELWDHFARPQAWRTYPEAPDVLANLESRGIRMMLASNFDGRLVRIARELEPLRPFRDVLVSSQLGFRKPHAQFFQAIIARAAVEPSEILYVGDDPHNDVSGARAAGLRALLIDRKRSGADGRIASLRKLLELA
jgi:putative hydrolase of the HAD superfamily